MSDSASAAGAADDSTAMLFVALWEALADTVGSAAAAIFLRRSHARALAAHPALGELAIDADGLDCSYSLPAHWLHGSDGNDALQALVDELCPLLAELTGAAVIDRLARVPALARGGITVERGRR